MPWPSFVPNAIPLGLLRSRNILCSVGLMKKQISNQDVSRGDGAGNEGGEDDEVHNQYMSFVSSAYAIRSDGQQLRLLELS